MHSATTKQRLSALRRRLGIFTGPPRWVRERRERLARSLAAQAKVAHGVPSEHPVPASPPRRPEPVEWVSDSMLFSSTAGAQAVRAPLAPRAVEATTELEERELPGHPGAVRRRPWAILAALAVVAGLLLSYAILMGSVPRGSAPAGAVGAASALAETPLSDPAPSAPAAAPAPAPVALPPAALEVRPGDTLWDLAARHLGDPFAWPRLHEANRDLVQDPDRIFPGQRLHLPAR